MAHSREWFLKRRRRRQKRNSRYGDKAAFHGINWDWYTHEQLFAFAKSADPAAMRRQANDWTELAGAIGDTTEQVRMIVRGLLQTWQGSAATQAAASNESLTQWAQGASETAKQIGVGLHQYTDAAAFAKANMPPPDSGEHFKTLVADGATQANSFSMIMSAISDQKAEDDRKREGKAEAVRVMKHYSNESQDVHNTMPWFYDAPAEQPGPAPVTDDDSNPDSDPGTDPRPGPPGTPGPLPGGRDTPSDGTTPEGFTSVEPGFGTGDGSRGGGPGSAGYGTGVPAGPGAGSGVDATRGPGAGGLSGAGGLAARGGGTPAGMAGGRGAAGAGGGFGAPFGGGMGAQRDEDKEHKNKFEEGLDLFDDLPPAYPSVFGA